MRSPTFKNGDVSIIVGPSDSGKSTGVLAAMQADSTVQPDVSKRPSLGVVYSPLREIAHMPSKLAEAVGHIEVLLQLIGSSSIYTL
jgi:ABC-type ATPase with predicted acetyltransferase domain